MNSQAGGAQDILSAALGQSGLSFDLLDDNSSNIYDNESITAVPEQSLPCATSAAIPFSDLDQLLGIVNDRKSVSQSLSADTSVTQGGSGVMYKNYSVMVNSAYRSDMTFSVPKEDGIIGLLAPSISQEEPKSVDFKDTELEILLKGGGNDGFECNSVKSFAESVLQVGGEGLYARTERSTDVIDPVLLLDRGTTKTSASPTPTTLPLVPRNVLEQKGAETGKGSSQGSIEKFEEEDEDYEELGHSDTYSEYMPAKCKIGAKHPDSVVETSSMSSVHAPDIWYRLSLPSEVIVKRYLSALQLEAIIYACQQHEKLLPIGKRAGYFIGDGAGVGKGRTVAGIIYENYLLGRKKAIWLSVSNDLKYDAVRDLRDIGCHIPVHSLNKFKYDEKISSKVNGKVKKGVIFATYSSLIGETQGRTMFRTRLSQLLQWCKEDYDGVLIFDECHKAKNLVPSGSSKPTKTGLTVLQLQDCLPKARVVYCSATGASEPRNMAYMNRLGIWGYGTAFPDFNSFLQSVEKRGVGAMEMVAMDMKLRGMYMARQLSFAGVNFDIQEVSLNKPFIEMYNASAKLWTETRDRFEQAASLMELDGKARKTMWGQFWSAHQRFFKYLCIASKVRKVVEIAREALECGKCVVIGLQTTGEAQMLEQLDEFRGEVTDFISTARGVYSGLVEKHFPSPGAVKFNEPVYDDDEEPLFPDSPQIDRKRKRAWKSEYQSKHKKPKDVGLFVDDGRLAESSDSDTEIDQILNGSDLSSNSGASSGSDTDEDDWLKALSSKPKVRKKKATMENKESIHTTDDSNSMNVFAAAGLNLGKQFLWATSDTANQLKSNRIGKASHPSGLVEKINIVSRQYAAVKGSMVDHIGSMKQELMEKFEIVSPYLPANTLDELIDELGGTDNVAEMTGRKGRIVCKEDGSFTYEPRCKDDVPLELLNIAEKKRFMDGEKLIAVISEAASSGVSLQADRRARNQRRRIHITLELPWSADKAIQQFGRTHRSNQVSAPEYLFLISELAGERRFSSVVAKRLESLGALTHGDRRATESRDLSRYNIDTKYGRIALESVLRTISGQEKTTVPFPVDYPGNFLQDCRSGLVGVGLILKDPSSGQHLLPEKDHSNIARFLNRILGLTVELQNALFTYFMDTLNEIIREAKRSGRWDEGILDMGSQGEMVKKLRVQTFLCPSTCGEVTAELITVAVERGLPWEKALHLCSSSVATEEGFYVSHQIRSSKRTAILVKRHGGTSRRRTYSVFKPNVGLQPKPELLGEIQKRFSKVMPDVAEPVWKEQFLFAEHNCVHSYWRGNCKKKYLGLSCEVGMRNRTCHVLSGSVLSVWSKVESVLMTQPGPQGKIQIIRVKLDDGGKVVGALIPSNCVTALVNALSSISVNKEVF